MSRTDATYKRGDERKLFRTALAVSLIVHGVALVYFARIAPKPMERKFITPFQMVELAEKGRGGGPAGPRAAAPAPAPRSRPEEIPPPPKPTAAAKEAPSKAVPKAPQSKPAPEPKPAPVPPSARAIPKDATKPQPAPAKPAPSYSEKDVEEKLRKIRQKFAATDTAPERGTSPKAGGSDAGVRSAVEAIRRRVGEPQPSRTGANQGAAHVAGPESPKGGGSGGGVSPEELKWSMYYNRVWAEVESNWAVPPSVTGKRYVTIVAVVLDRRGNVLKSWIEEPSGNTVYDEAAIKAILRSAPLPALPADIPDATVPLGFRFIE